MITTNDQFEKDQPRPLPRWLKTIYGTGDWGKASFNTLRQIFYAIFLTDVVGLDPRLASFAALISIIWDAINDPLIGALSDRVRTRWGRRRPFLLFFAIPFGCAFVLLWWAPPWENQWLRMLTVTLAYMLSDTIQTLINVPYLALTPEIAPNYDDRTSLTSYRMFFNLLASLATAVAAPNIVDAAVNSGLNQQQGYIIVAAIFGSLAVIPYFLVFAFIREKPSRAPSTKVAELAPSRALVQLWLNTPFRYAVGIYVLTWICFDTVALMLPYYLLYWISEGNLVSKINLLGQNLSIESAVLGILLIVATFTIPLWNFVAKRFNKKTSYITGMLFWIAVQIYVIFIQPHQIPLILLFSFLAGLSVSTAHVIPESMIPDVIDWDEFRTHTRHEGMYYGAMNFFRKLSSALAVFIALQILGWFGYQAPPEGAAIFTQSPTTIWAIRIMTGPGIILFLFAAVTLAWFYPLSRERQSLVSKKLINRRKNKSY